MRISVNLHRILFNLFVLTVNLNLYCSSEAREVRANRLYCVCLTSTNYGHCGFRARWSCVNFERQIRTRIASICSKTSSRPKRVFKLKLRERLMKVPSWYQNHKQVQHFPKAKRKKVLLQIFSAPTYFTLLIDANIRVSLYV